MINVEIKGSLDDPKKTINDVSNDLLIEIDCSDCNHINKVKLSELKKNPEIKCTKCGQTTTITLNMK